MKITSVLFDIKNNKVSVDSLISNAKEARKTRVVFAHVGVVNENGLLLNADSLEVTREKYPLLVEHSDKRVEDVVGYITTNGKPNENGEFIGELYFYNTEQGKHAGQLWLDGVFNELSVSYYIKSYDIIEQDDESSYIEVKSAILKEVSIVSVGADRETGEVKNNADDVKEPDEVEEINEPEELEKVENNADEVEEINELEELEKVENNAEEVEALKLEKLKKIILNA